MPTASYAQGLLSYRDDSGDTHRSHRQIRSPNSTPHCQVCNTTIYPNPPGANPNALGYFKSMPAANGTTLGDGFNTGSYYVLVAGSRSA